MSQTISGTLDTVQTLNAALPNVTITGALNAYGSVGVFPIDSNGTLTNETVEAAIFGPASGHFTIHNSGRVESHGSSATNLFDAGIALGTSGKIFNAGTIRGATGVAVFGTIAGSYLENSKLIKGSIGAGAILTAAASVTNSGTIIGETSGVLELGGGGVSNTSTGIVLGLQGYGVQLQGAGTMHNSGAITGKISGVDLQGAKASVSNAGIITETAVTRSLTTAAGVYAGVVLGQGGRAGNSGTITGQNGINLLNGSNITAGSIGYVHNIGLINAFSTVDLPNYFTFNSFSEGFEKSGAGIYLAGAGTVVNSGSIGGNHVGVVVENAPGLVNNSGVITSSGGYGVYLNVGGTVINSGKITGYQQGVFIGTSQNPADASDPRSVVNTGLIDATAKPYTVAGGHYTYISTAVFVVGGGFADNAAGGRIDAAYGAGILLFGDEPDDVTNTDTLATANIVNAGTIIAQYGANLYGIGSLTNAGTIIGQKKGINLADSAASGLNTGLIEAELGGYTFVSGTLTVSAIGTAVELHQASHFTNSSTGKVLALAGDGIDLEAGGFINNAGTIIGDLAGIELAAGGTVTDSGVITGTGAAVDFSAGFAGRLIISPTARFSGEVNGGNTLGASHVSVLELATGATAGTLSAFGTQFVDFGSIVLDAHAAWDITGATTLAAGLALTNEGMIFEAGTDSLSIFGPISGTGTIALGPHALKLTGSVAAGQTIQFSGTGETLDLGSPAAFKGEIGHFTLGDTIDLTGMSLASVKSLHFGGGVLTIAEATGTLMLDFIGPSSFGTESFMDFAIGAGTGITLHSPAAATVPALTAADFWPPAAAREALGATRPGALSPATASLPGILSAVTLHAG